MINRAFHLHDTFVDAESGTVLLLNPKVMSTFSRAFLRDGLRRFRGWEDPSQGRWRLSPLARRFPLPTAGTLARALIRPQGFEAVAFVRNPHARLVSAWQNKIADPPKPAAPGARRTLRPTARERALPPLRAFARRRGAPGAAEGEVVPFPVFVDWLAEGRSRDRHWALQTRVLQTGHFRFHRFWKVETERDEGFLDLGRRLGFKDRWVRRRLEGRTPNASSADPAAHYDDALAARVFEMFREDFEAFGYGRDDWRALRARRVA